MADTYDSKSYAARREGSTPPGHQNMPKSKLPYKEFKWTPALAYAIGLLVTDGNLSKDGRHITMTSVDKSLLKTFKLCLKIKNKITPSYNNGYSKRVCYRVQFSDVQLYNWFLDIGITLQNTYYRRFKYSQKCL